MMNESIVLSNGLILCLFVCLSARAKMEFQLEWEAAKCDCGTKYPRAFSSCCYNYGKTWFVG